ncbi:MAG: hypothetical protein KF774_00390 [Planctomyces sp.]|nr:hypothetical protein [Planctomyces sp.]
MNHPQTTALGRARPERSGLAHSARRESVLDDFLRRVSLWRNTLRTLTHVGWLCVAAVAAAFLAILSDAAFAWSVPVRIAIDAAALGLLAAAGIAQGIDLWRRRYDASRTARLAEERLGRSDSLLINAVSFQSDALGGSPVLRARVIRMAEESVRETAVMDVLPARPAVRAGGAAVIAAVAFGMAFLAAPKLFGMVLPRFLDPWGDHPPYTLLSFEARIAPEPVFHSRPATITVEVRGPDRVEEARLVFQHDPQGGDALNVSIPMFRTEDRTFVAEIARAVRSTAFHVETPRGRSERFELQVTEVPFFEEAKARLEPPAYTGWKAQDQPLNQRGLRGIVGSRVRVAARSNLELSAGRLLLHPAAAKGQAAPDPIAVKLTPAADDPRRVEGEFPLEFNGRFELSLTSRAGVDSQEPIAGPLTAIPDRGPQVSITNPDEYLVAVEGWKVPVTVEAVDDVAISRMRVFRTVNGWIPVPVDLERQPGQPHVGRAAYEFDLDQLGAQAGDVITYYATAEDNFPGGPRSADSRMHTLQVISQDEYREFARQQYQMDDLAEEFETFRKELDRLGAEREELLQQLDELRKQAEAGTLGDEDSERLEQLEKQLEQFARDSERLEKNLEDRAQQLQLYELEKEYGEELQKLAKHLQQQSQNSSEVAQSLSRMRQSSGDPDDARKQFQNAEEKFRKEQEPFDDASREHLDSMSQDLELMRLADSMLAQIDRLQAVITQQRDLANRMAELAGKTSLSADEEARAERFAKEQELLQQELESLQKDLQEAADAGRERLPKMSDSADSICEKIGELQIPADQQTAAQASRDGNGDQAHRHAENAARKLESLQAEAGQCQQCQGLQDGLDGPLSLSRQRLGQCLQQMSQGRRVPGLGKRGQGQGQGEGGTSGGQGEGQAQGQGQGGQGDGLWRPGQSFPGSQANMQVAGPRTQDARESAKNTSMQSDGRGRGIAPEGVALPADNESLNPESRRFSGSSGGQLRGVPVGYRDAAEAYFRRLAEERTPK